MAGYEFLTHDETLNEFVFLTSFVHSLTRVYKSLPVWPREILISFFLRQTERTSL